MGTHRRALLLLGLAATPFVVSCNVLTPLVFLGDHKKKITAEYDKLSGRRVAVLVWTEAGTLFDYPFARLELATFLSDKLSTELGGRELAVDVVRPRDVEEYLQREPSAQVDPAMVGRQFKAEAVLYVEVVEFQFRDAERPQFLQGRIKASVSVYDVARDADRPSRVSLAPVECIYPGTPVLMDPNNALLVREATYQQFAEVIARKFYEHTVEL